MAHNRNYHREFSGENDQDQTYELRGRLDVTRRTNAEAIIARNITQESRNAIDAVGTQTSTRPDVTTDRAVVTLNHRFNRLSLQLRGDLSKANYEDATAPAANNQLRARDIKTRRIAMRAQWEFRPTFSVFGEVEQDQRRHKAAPASDNLLRNSDGERYRAGLSFGQTGEFLRGEASIGYGIQRPDANALPDADAFLIDANVAWRVSRLTSLLFEASTSIDETTRAGASGVVNRSIGIGIRHAFRRHIIGEADVSYRNETTRGSSLRERDITFKSSVEYIANRHLALFARSEHTMSRSNQANSDYDVSSIMVGARLRN
jgi:hypothetical protein